MKKAFRISTLVILALSGALVIFIGVMWAKEYTPSAMEDHTTEGLNPDTIHKDTLKLISWNIGYAGLGDNTDFFYDGGTMTRDTRERTVENLRAIVEFLKGHSDADFILLQEVDFDSKRSYGINEYDTIRDALPQYFGYYGLNYVSSYVPIPLTDPIGRVKSGVVTLSRYAPSRVVRLQYPSKFPFPTSLFNLKRCLLTEVFRTRDLGYLFVNNTHNTAYDTGDMRSKEFEFLKEFLADKPLSVTAGDWNSNPWGYKPSDKELSDKHFVPAQVAQNDLGDGIHLAWDTTSGAYTVRYGYERYRKGETTRSVIDFAALGSGVKEIKAEVVDLGFRNSDHNPMILTFVILR